MKDGKIRHAGGPEIVTEDALRETFDASLRLVELDGRKIVLS